MHKPAVTYLRYLTCSGIAILIASVRAQGQSLPCSSTFGTLKSADESDQGICDVFVGPDGDVMEVIVSSLLEITQPSRSKTSANVVADLGQTFYVSLT